MASDPIGTISGLSSGIQWRDMIDQIMNAEKARTLDPVTSQQTALTRQASAWTTFQGLVAKLRTTAAALREPTALDAVAASATRSPSSSRDLVSATTTSDAAPGSYGVEVIALARAEKLGGAFVANSTAALGVSGQFTVNGSAITVAAGDTLVGVRDKINAANSGASPSGVSATIISSAAGAHIVLTSGATGASGIDLVDGSTGALQSLGFIDATVNANITAAGATQTFRTSSASIAIGAYLGLTMPAPSTIKVGGAVVSVDLSVDSLTTIADKINAATGNASAASVQSETANGKTTYRLVTDATVGTDASVNLADSVQALAVLGFTKAGRAGVTQVLKSANTFVDAGTGLNATGAALLTDLQTNGQLVGIAATDTVNISGTRGDGTTFTSSVVVGAGTTLQDIVDAVTAAGAGARAATASLSGGRIAITDATAGDSQLALSLTVTTAGGSTTSLGALSTANGGTAGLTRQVAAAADAQMRVDGQLVRRSSNSISDAITGVTVNLLNAEPGTSVNLLLARDANTIVQGVRDFVAAYNAAKSFIATYSADGGTFAHNGALRSMSASLTQTLLATVTGTSGTFTTAAVAGLQHDKSGVLSLDAIKFAGYLQTNFADVKKLFSMTGTPSDTEVSFVAAGPAAKPTATPYAIDITRAATQASVTGSVWATYATAGAPDTMSVTDASTGKTASVTIANGDAIATAVQKLNSVFALNGMQLSATVTGDSRVKITGTGYGSGAGFTVAYTPGLGGDGTAMLGVTAQAYTGLDVTGTINGVAGVGIGQLLTGKVGDASESIAVRYSGTTARAAGTLAFSVGMGGAMTTISGAIGDATSGTATVASTNATDQATALKERIANIQKRLDARRAALTAQFLAMESALTKAQAIGGALSAQINALQPKNN